VIVTACKWIVIGGMAILVSGDESCKDNDCNKPPAGGQGTDGNGVGAGTGSSGGSAAVDPSGGSPGNAIDPSDPDAVSAGHKAARIDAIKNGTDVRADSRYGGNCTPDEYEALRDATWDACKDPANGAQTLGKCFPGMTPFAIATRIQQWTNCARARENEANRCFAGGNKGHIDQINDAWKVVEKCGGTVP
jgi:hypothetical protein